MRLPLSILIAAAAAIAVVFAIPNRKAVTIRFWPFDTEIVVALYLVVFAAIFAGFVTGWIGAWLSQHKWRKRARDQARRIEHLEQEVMELADAAAKPPAAESTPVVPLERWTLPGA
jgi:uncharacterized membrane protein YciS (DUF1049 family)